MMTEADRTAQSPMSLVDALLNKYSTEDDSFDYIQVPTKGPGMTDSGHLVLPPILAVDLCGIQVAGSEDQICSYCTNVKELDLTKNDITSWQEVLKIMRNIPRMHFLNLTSNSLLDSSWPESIDDCEFPRIQHLVLNNIGLSWESIHKVLQMCPSVTELHLSLNSFSSVELPKKAVTYPNLRKLHLTGNSIQQWSELNKVGRLFPNLEYFVNIESELVTLECGDDIGDIFSHLKALNLSDNKLASWDEVDRLRIFPALTDIRITGIPFLEKIEENSRRQQIIARLPNLAKLNGCPVTEGEREDAERAFIRLFMDSNDQKPQMFSQLEKKYGKLDPLANVDLAPKNIFHLKVIYEDKVERMDINVKQTVKEFKKLLVNFTGVPYNKLQVFHEQMTSEGLFFSRREMKLPDKSLYTLNFTDHDEIVCYKR